MKCSNAETYYITTNKYNYYINQKLLPSKALAIQLSEYKPQDTVCIGKVNPVPFSDTYLHLGVKNGSRYYRQPARCRQDHS